MEAEESFISIKKITLERKLLYTECVRIKILLNYKHYIKNYQKGIVRDVAVQKEIVM